MIAGTGRKTIPMGINNSQSLFDTFTLKGVIADPDPQSPEQNDTTQLTCHIKALFTYYQTSTTQRCI